ncbi:MAG TPA: sugar phosphate isomerase/epimerase [Parafilimonas sp.]|nr:sugar phosphate isomerase/epimerase [Parafilimonas sp.]
MHSRRKFIQHTAMGVTASAALPLFSKASRQTSNQQKHEPLKMGMAGYTFLNFDVATSINMMKRVNVTALSIKDFHLPLDSSPDKIKDIRNQFTGAGITPYAVGVIYMKTKEAVDQTFAYAKNVGVNMIVGVPDYELLDHTEEKVKEYNIKIAIHNHGPMDKLYPGPKDAYDRISKRDKRMGLCIDIGHTQRTGIAPADAVLQFKDRLFDLHIKDVTAANNDGQAIEIGRGVIDFPALVNALNKINYTGFCSVEFEKDMKDPMPGIAESVGYFRGVMKATDQ